MGGHSQKTDTRDVPSLTIKTKCLLLLFLPKSLSRQQSSSIQQTYSPTASKVIIVHISHLQTCNLMGI